MGCPAAQLAVKKARSVANTDNALCVRGVLLGQKTPSDLVIRAGRIAAVRPASRRRADIGSRNSHIGPTLFDIQVNGAFGVDLQDPKLEPEDVAALSDLLAGQGIAHWVPTLVTGPSRVVERNCRVVAEALRDKALARAVPGIHLEGPYISKEDGPRGAHPKRHVRNPDIREFERLLNAAEGRVLYLTLAPELPGAVPFIESVVRQGVLVALGHHNASPEAIGRAVDAGARLATHLGNGLAAKLPRHVNPLWPQLADDRLFASFIPDLEHLPPEVLKTFLRAKGPERSIAISDIVYCAGLEPGMYQFQRADVELLPSGRICLKGTEFLAGSSLFLLQGIVNLRRVAGLTLEQAFACATAVPTRLLGLNYRFSQPRVGEKANFLVFDIDRTQPRWRPVLHAVFLDGHRKA